MRKPARGRGHKDNAHVLGGRSSPGGGGYPAILPFMGNTAWWLTGQDTGCGVAHKGRLGWVKLTVMCIAKQPVRRCGEVTAGALLRIRGRYTGGLNGTFPLAHTRQHG